MVYLITEGGIVRNQRSRLPNRFKILDEIMKMEDISQKPEGPCRNLLYYAMSQPPGKLWYLIILLVLVNLTADTQQLTENFS